jgi:hypothetical protein
MTEVARRVRAIPGWQATLAVALCALGFLVTAQLRSEAPRVRYTTQERSPLVETALALQSQQDQLKARILELRAEIGALEQRSEGNETLVAEVNEQLDVARSRAAVSCCRFRTPPTRCRRARTRATRSSRRGTCEPPSSSCGSPAPRRSRSTGSASSE